MHEPGLPVMAGAWGRNTFVHCARVANKALVLMEDVRDEEFDGEVVDQIAAQLKESFEPVAFPDAEAPDLVTSEEISNEMRSLFGPIPRPTLTHLLRECGFRCTNIQGTFYWLMRRI